MTPSARSRAGPQEGDASPEAARERILRTAYDLFCNHGLQAVGVDRISDEAGVAKVTLYRNFRSKDELALAVLERREKVWISDWLEREVERRGRTAEERLLAIFDAFDEWFRREDYESCLFTTCLLETHDLASPVGAASVRGLVHVRSFVEGLAKEAGVRDSAGFARQWQILMLGSIIAASAGDLEAAKRARDVALPLLEREGLGRGFG
jgi:AcrR family transcriptional regulator